MAYVTYGELDLRKVREENGLDFAHYTYMKDMCTCCSTPLEFPARYWHRGIKPQTMDGVQYLIFKNAENGSGIVKRTDYLKNCNCVGWNFPIEKLEKVCQSLQEQVGPSHLVLMPPEKDTQLFCIQIINTKEMEKINEELACGYRPLKIGPELFARMLARIEKKYSDDPEIIHVEMDALMCMVLSQNGYGEGIEIFKKAKKY